MPGPKSTPVKASEYREDVRTARAKAKPNSRAAKRLATRQDDFDAMTKSAKNPGAFTRPGSQNRSK